MNVVKIIDVETFLNEIKGIEKDIENKKAEIDYLRERALSLGGAPLGGDVSKTSKPTDRIGSVIAKIIDDENELADEVIRYLDLRKKARKLIDQLPNSLHRDVLFKHHFQNIPLTKIAKEKNCDYSSLLEAHKKAKEALQELLPPEIVK